MAYHDIVRTTGLSALYAPSVRSALLRRQVSVIGSLVAYSNSLYIHCLEVAFKNRIQSFPLML